MTGDGGAGQTSGNDGGGGGGQEEKNKKKEKPIGYWRKLKMVVLSRIKKAKKRSKRKKIKGKGGLASGNCCCCCLHIRGMPKLDSLSSSSESPTSDPNCSEFGFESLRGLIEKSDFLLKECNTHLDVYSPPNDNYDDDLHDD